MQWRPFEVIRENTRKLALELDVIGLMNIQYAVKLDEEKVYIIEANPRASRTVPFVEVRNTVVASALSAIIGHKMINDKSNNGIIFFMFKSLHRLLQVPI